MITQAYRKIERHIRLTRLGKTLRKGVIPNHMNITHAQINEALTYTSKAKQGIEMWGVLSSRVLHPDGTVKREQTVQAVKKVTASFAQYLAKAMITGGASINGFNFHGCGCGSAAEDNTDHALGSEDGNRQTGTKETGASDNIYRTIGTITATSAWTAIEHGLFVTAATDAGASQTNCMLDRSVLGTPVALVTDDIITFTYDLTISAEA